MPKPAISLCAEAPRRVPCHKKRGVRDAAARPLTKSLCCASSRTKLGSTGAFGTFTRANEGKPAHPSGSLRPRSSRAASAAPSSLKAGSALSRRASADASRPCRPPGSLRTRRRSRGCSRKRATSLHERLIRRGRWRLRALRNLDQTLSRDAFGFRLKVQHDAVPEDRKRHGVHVLEIRNAAPVHRRARLRAQHEVL